MQIDVSAGSMTPPEFVFWICMRQGSKTLIDNQLFSFAIGLEERFQALGIWGEGSTLACNEGYLPPDFGLHELSDLNVVRLGDQACVRRQHRNAKAGAHHADHCGQIRYLVSVMNLNAGVG